MNILRAAKVYSVTNNQEFSNDEWLFFNFLEGLDYLKTSTGYFYYRKDHAKNDYNCVLKCNSRFFIFDYNYMLINLVTSMDIKMGDFSEFINSLYLKYSNQHVTVGTNMGFDIWE